MISLSPSRTLRSLLTCALLAFGALAHAQQVFRVTTIPEEAATEQVRKFTPLAAHLEAALGVKVEFTPVSDYPAAVESLVNKKVDLVWFGGFTHVQANLRSGGRIVPLAQREEDARFQSVFIAKTDSGIKSLADMKGKQVSFGSQSSTSGHLMPRSFLLQAGVDPDKDFRRVAYSGAHDATIAAVASGKTDQVLALMDPTLRAEIDEPVLKEIASKTGGRYFRATDNNKLVEVYAEIDKLEKSKIDVRQFIRKEEKFFLPAVIIFILLALEILARTTVYRNIT